MRRLKDKQDATLAMARAAYNTFSDHKHHRTTVKEFEDNLETNLKVIIDEIITESWKPAEYTEKIIYEKKERHLAKAPVYDHVLEATTLYPYEKALYDYTAWNIPAVKPGLGTHAMMRFLRNSLYKESQEENMYYFLIDGHHYFPSIDHQLMVEAIVRKIKDGKLRRFCLKVVDSYYRGIPLGIKIAQIFGQIYLAVFDRLAMRFFDIVKDPEKMAYWTERYITSRILTAKSTEDYEDLARGSQYLAEKFRSYAFQGLKHYLRFVDGIIVRHSDKAFLHIVLEISIMILERDFHFTVNKDYNIRPTWTGIKIVGYVFYHDHVEVTKLNKQRNARRIHKLKKKGYNEEQIRLKMASSLGYIKHANSINLLKKIGMEKTLGKIIKSRRLNIPFEGMSSGDKVLFSAICKKINESGVWDKKILLVDYDIEDSKIEKEKITVQVPDSEGNPKTVEKEVAGRVLAIRFKKIMNTNENNGETIYVFEKKKDADGRDTLLDAEFYAFTGSRILINQSETDFSKSDLPCPTVIQEFRSKAGKSFYKFT